MKHILYLSLITTGLLVFSCKKENPTTEEKPGSTISSKDPVEVSKNIKVWHGMRLAGSAPSPKDGVNAPVIEVPTKTINAFAGKFAIIKPTIKQGDVAGFYISVKGAAEYFKVDYTKPRRTERHINTTVNRQSKKHSGIGFRTDSTGSGSNYADSAIVITLPPNFQTPDTFCVTYCAYDEAGNISEPVTSCIIVSKLGGDANSDFLEGTWRVQYWSLDSNFNHKLYDTLVYNKWAFWELNSSYFCNTKADGTNFIENSCNDMYGPCTEINIADSIYREKWDITFKKSGDNFIEESALFKSFDVDSSTCANYKYFVEPDIALSHGGWTINGNKMVIIYDFDGYKLSAEEYIYEKLSNSEISLKITYNGKENEEYIYKKL